MKIISSRQTNTKEIYFQHYCTREKTKKISLDRTVIPNGNIRTNKQKA